MCIKLQVNRTRFAFAGESHRNGRPEREGKCAIERATTIDIVIVNKTIQNFPCFMYLINLKSDDSLGDVKLGDLEFEFCSFKTEPYRYVAWAQ